MPKTQAEIKAWRKQAYGFADIDGYMESVRDAQKWDSTLNAYMSGAASVLSDAQELIDLGDANAARQNINIAKALIFSARIEDRGKTDDQYATAVKVLTDLPEL